MPGTESWEHLFESAETFLVEEFKAHFFVSNDFFHLRSNAAEPSSLKILDETEILRRSSSQMKKS